MIRFKNITKTALSLVLVASMTLPVMQTAIVSQAADLTTEEISEPEIVGGSDNLGNAIGVSEEYRTYNGYSYNKLTDCFEAPITYNGKTYVESVPRATVEKSNWFVEMYGEEFRGVSVSEFTRKANGIAIVGSFTPSRTYYAQFLASYSGTQNDIVKGVWEKLFYEENNWNSSKSYYTAGYSKWSDKYYSTYSSVTNDDYRSSKGQTITYSTGDWEIYFGSALVNNPDFLGEMLGLTGQKIKGKTISAPGTDAAGNELMKQIMTTYLKNPAKYKDLARQIVNLTADGTYIGTEQSSSANILKSGSYNGIRYDYYMLMTLASFYTGSDNEPTLNSTQVRWIKSYMKDLYEAYTGVTNNPTLKNIVASYPTIYDAIARSTYASNDTTSWGQKFFDYVESSSKGGTGAWLNQNNNINISGLGSFGSLTSVFKASQGYCAGEHSPHSDCSYGNDCYLVANGGRAQPTDRIAYLVYMNDTARKYIENSSLSALKKQYTNASGADGGWLERYGWKHQGPVDPTPKPYVVYADIVTGGNFSGTYDAVGETCWEGRKGGGKTPIQTATVHLDQINAKTGENILSKVEAVTVNFSYSPGHEDGDFGGFDGWDVTGAGVGYVSYNNKTFDISKIKGSAARANTELHVRMHGGCGYYANPLTWGDGHNHCVGTGCTAKTTASATAALSVRRSDCTVRGYHIYQGEPHFDLKNMTATIEYTCKDDTDHGFVTEPLPLTITEKANGDVKYTVTSPYSYKKNDAGQYTSEPDSYSTYVFASGSSTENIPMSSSYTTLSEGVYSGSTIYNSASSNELINPAGSRSQDIYKSATSTITFKTKKNVILPGCKKLVVNVGAQGDLINLSITVRDRYNNVLAVNSQPKSRNVVDLIGLSDDELNGAFVEVTATSNTTNWAHSSTLIGGRSDLVAAASTKVTAYSIDFYYQ